MRSVARVVVHERVRGARASAAAAALLLLAAALAALAPGAYAHTGGQHIFQESGAVYSVAWNRQGTLLAVATASGQVALIDGVNHVALKNWTAALGPINEVVFSPDGSKIAVATGAYKVDSVEKSLKVWDIIGPTLLLNITGHYDWVTSVAWSPDGSMLASSSGVDDHENASNIFGQVMFWNASTGALLWNASPLDSYPARISWAPDGHAVAAVGHLNDVWLLDPYSTPKKMTPINHTYRDPVGHASHGWAIAWSPDSRLLIGGFSYDFDYDGGSDVGPDIVFDPSLPNPDGFATQIKRADLHTKPAEWVGWDSSGTWVASCSGVDMINATGPTPVPGQDKIVDAGELIVYNFTNSTGRTLKGENVFIFGRSWCSSLAWRPGNLTIAAGNADGSVKIYVLDEDGDGCMLWIDAAPQDPSTCEAAAVPPSDFFQVWGVPLLALTAVMVGAIGVLAILGSSVRKEPEPKGRERNGKRRTGGRRSAPRRR